MKSTLTWIGERSTNTSVTYPATQPLPRYRAAQLQTLWLCQELTLTWTWVGDRSTNTSVTYPAAQPLPRYRAAQLQTLWLCQESTLTWTWVGDRSTNTFVTYPATQPLSRYRAGQLQPLWLGQGINPYLVNKSTIASVTCQDIQLKFGKVAGQLPPV